MLRIIPVIFCALFVVAGSVPGAADHPCDPYSPFYTRIETGPGALLADVFLFAMSAPVVVGTAGGRRRPVINQRTGEVRHVSTAACLPITVARHFVQNRPPHVEHWRAYD